MDQAEITLDKQSQRSAIPLSELVRWGERLVLIPLAALVIARIAPQLPQHPQLALFLASQSARHITGQTLHVSSGALAHFG